MSRKIISEKPITLEQVKELLRLREANAELNYIQRVTLEYAHKFSRELPHSEELLDILSEKFQISREKGIQLINIKPQKIEELSLILEEKFDEETKNEIIETFEEHLRTYGSDTDLEPEELPEEDSSETDEDSDL